MSEILDGKMTRRNRITTLLRSCEQPMTLRALSIALGIPEHVIASDLGHIAKSVRASGEQLQARPATCLECDFVFDSARVKSPSKCPRCRSTRIGPPAFTIRALSGTMQ